MKRTHRHFLIRLLVVLLLVQPLLGSLGVWERAGAETNTPLEQVNAALDRSSGDEMLAALTDENATWRLPDGFGAWSDEDQAKAVTAIMKTITDFGATRFENEGQVQFLLDLVNITFANYEDFSLTTLRGKLDLMFELFATAPEVFEDSDSAQTVAGIAAKLSAYGDMTEAEKQIYTYLLKMQLPNLVRENPFYVALIVINTFPDNPPSINRAASAEDMADVLDFFLQVPAMQQAFKDQYSDIPLEEWPLDFSRAYDPALTEEDREALPPWLLDKRPEGGYATIDQIQNAFDNFFADIAVKAVNQAIEDENTEALLNALQNPALGLTLPEGFDEWDETYRSYLATTFFKFFSEPTTLDTAAQVKAILDFAVVPLQMFDDRSLTSVGDTLDLFFEKLPTLTSEFPDLEIAELLDQLAEQYAALQPLDKEIYTYYMYLLLNEPSGAMLNYMAIIPISVLSGLPRINQAAELDEMMENLTTLREIQSNAEQFGSDVQLESWKLDLSRMDGLEDEDIEALAQWMIDQRPEAGYASLEAVQTAFDLYFAPAAPQVTADDATDKLVGADATMEYSTDDGATWTNYDPDQAPAFSGNVTVLVRVKASADKPAGRTTSVTFTQPVVYVPSSPSTSTETVYIDVEGSDGGGLARTPITRTTDSLGKIKDSVSLSADIAKEAVAKAKAQGSAAVRIVLPDPTDKVSEAAVNVPQAALKEIADAQISLEIAIGDAVVTIPAASLSGFGQDLYFRLVPVKTDDGRAQVETRAKQEASIQSHVRTEAVKVLGRPMEIETNLQGKEVTVLLPVKEGLPADQAGRTSVLNRLGVYAEHGDGTKELLKGQIVDTSTTTGIRFTTQKFSTFSLVYMDGWDNGATATATHAPYINGFGKQFRPDDDVTRAQMAAMLARNLPGIEVEAGANPGADVGSSHWARADIAKAQAAGIMSGIADGLFDPEGAVTRAQMATIAARWLQRNAAPDAAVATGASGYADVSADHWAAQAITQVSAAGLMTGYGNDTFKPDQKLTRAEAVKVLNRLFGRGPLNGATTVTFEDVPATHWAYQDIEEAATSHTYTIDAQGAEQAAAN